MTTFRPILTVGLTLAAACGPLVWGGPLAAAPVPLSVPFAPPEMSREKVCQPRPPLHEVVARWAGWDGQDMGGRTIEEIRRDLRILRESDAQAWLPTIEAAMDVMRTSDPEYSEQDWLMDRIDLVRAAGQPAFLESEGLVERFLASGIDGSPRAEYVASQLLRDGTGVEADKARATELLIAAAYGGNSEALEELAVVTSDGTEVPGWAIDPSLAVTLAFGGFLGDVDPMICDRIGRIASAYRLGGTVARDVPLAERWYRLAADLGDFNAAWQVAQLHTFAEGIDKDNEVLLTYLQQAADGGLPFAQAELGRIHEVGALVPRDLDRARVLYEQAAAAGHREGLMRLATLFKTHGAPTEADRARRIEVLHEMAEGPEASPWALIEIGDLVQQTKGRWAGEAEAATAYGRALELSPQDEGATLRLAAIRFREADTPQAFDDIAASLSTLMLETGGAPILDALVSAMTCRRPAGPDRVHADYWRGIREDVGNVSVAPLSGGMPTGDPTSLLVQAQSQAVVGRGSSLAVLLDMEADQGLTLDRDALLRLSRAAGNNPLTEAGKLALDEATLPVAIEAGRATLREAIAAGEKGAAEELADQLLSDGVTAAEEPELRALAVDLAAKGKGIGLQALAVLEGDDAEARAAVFAAHQDIIDADGDFAALLFAMPHLGDEAALDDYLGRARAAMPCNTFAALGLAETLRDLGRQDEVEHWLDVADAAGRSEGWLAVVVADAYRKMSARPDALQIAFDLLNEARQNGNRQATLRLAALAENEAAGFELPPEELADLFVDVISVSDVTIVPNVLRQVRRADPEVRRLVEARIDVRALYESAAAAGSPVGQVELAKLVRAEAVDEADLVSYGQLLTSAAEQGQPEAMYLLSTAYAFGLGVEPSLEASRDWLQKAAEAGYDEAEETIRLLGAPTISQ